ncbi:MAG: sulfotransferase family 2 domain-containing protein [Novosphingobium sp.]
MSAYSHRSLEVPARQLSLLSSPKLILFYATGLANTAFAYGVYAAMVFAGLSPQAAQFLGRIIGILFNFITYSNIILPDSRFFMKRFIISYGINYLITVCLLEIWILILQNPFTAGLITLAISTTINFIVLRLFVVQSGHASGAYVPSALRIRGLPDFLILPKDAARDIAFAVIRRLQRTAPGRLLWKKTAGKYLARQIDKHKYLLIHIPKTGGTSVSSLLYEHNLPHLTALDYRALFGKHFDDWSTFAVLRDPLRRFLSAYRFTLQGGTDIMLTSRFERRRLGLMEPLEAFVARLENDPALQSIAPQFTPQAHFVTDPDGNILVDRLYVIDGREEQLARLARWLGVERIPRLNMTARTPLDIDADLVRRIRALYATDIELYRRVVANDGSLVIRSRPS